MFILALPACVCTRVGSCVQVQLCVWVWPAAGGRGRSAWEAQREAERAGRVARVRRGIVMRPPDAEHDLNRQGGMHARHPAMCPLQKLQCSGARTCVFEALKHELQTGSKRFDTKTELRGKR